MVHRSSVQRPGRECPDGPIQRARRRRSSVGKRRAALVAAAIGLASCGSRTGLFGGSGRSAPNPGPTTNVLPTEPPPEDALPVGCVPGKFTFDLATAQLMFVVDRSGSMGFTLDGETQPEPGRRSRWETLREALFQTIVPFDEQLAMGAKFFPEVLSPDRVLPSEDACSTPTGIGIPPARGNASAILGVFDTTTPRGGTPTAQAVQQAAEYLAQRRTVARSLVLATDGAPNCNPRLDGSTCTCATPGVDCAASTEGSYSCLDDGVAVAAIRAIAEEKKIPVYVVGIGSTERAEFLRVLDDMAVAGGRARPASPRHYNVQTATEMRAALATIRDGVARCTYLTPSSPHDPNAIAVSIDGQAISRDTSHANGWDWVDQTYGTLAFFGPACDRAGSASPRVVGDVVCDEP